MKKKHLALAATVALSAALFSVVPSASAAVIGFDNLSGNTGDPLSVYHEAGFTVTPDFGAWKEGHVLGNPLPSVYVQDFTDPPFGSLLVKADGGGLFKFSSLDLTAFNSNVGYEIAGSLGGVQQFSKADFHSAGPAFTTLLSNSDLSIDTLRIDVSSGGIGSFNVDNINVTAVPEPETTALLASGLGLVGWIARRRKVKAAAQCA